MGRDDLSVWPVGTRKYLQDRLDKMISSIDLTSIKNETEDEIDDTSSSKNIQERLERIISSIDLTSIKDEEDDILEEGEYWDPEIVTPPEITAEELEKLKIESEEVLLEEYFDVLDWSLKNRLEDLDWHLENPPPVEFNYHPEFFERYREYVKETVKYVKENNFPEKVEKCLRKISELKKELDIIEKEIADDHFFGLTFNSFKNNLMEDKKRLKASPPKVLVYRPKSPQRKTVPPLTEKEKKEIRKRFFRGSYLTIKEKEEIKRNRKILKPPGIAWIQKQRII